VSPPVAAAAREVTLSITGTAQKTAPAAALFLRRLRRLIWLSVVLKTALDHLEPVLRKDISQNGTNTGCLLFAASG
jgi:hypothetical protein